MPYVTSWERIGMKRGMRKGLRKGKQEGRQEGVEEGRQTQALALVLRLLRRKLGEIAAPTTKRIEKLPLKQLEQLSEDLLDFTTRRDLTNWLRKHSASRSKSKPVAAK